MSHNNDSIEINSPLTKEDITQIVNSETMQQVIKDSHDAWEKTKFKWQIFVALIMAASAAFGYYLKWDSDRKDRIEQQIQAANERRAEEIQARINLKMEWMRRADLAVMDMRKTREIILMKCQYHIHQRQYDESIQRFNSRYELTKAFDGIRFIFDDNIQNKFLELTNFDESVKNVCNKNAPSDIRWYNYAYQLNDMMNKSIEIDKANKEQLN